MRLVRILCFSSSADLRGIGVSPISIKSIRIGHLGGQFQEGGDEVTSINHYFYAESSRSHRLKLDDEGFLDISQRDIRELEASLEATANFIALKWRCEISLSSSHPHVALIPESNDEFGSLDECRGTPPISGRLRIEGVGPFEDLKAEHLVDRMDGLSLMTEAQSHKRPAGRFMHLARLFENAYGMAFHRLADQIFDFLYQSDMGFERAEVRRWTDQRHGMFHADKAKTSEVLLSSDVDAFLPRMEQAAYDTLFNKVNWNEESTHRTPRVSMPTRSTSKGGAISPKGAEVKTVFEPRDPFDSYPAKLEWVNTDLLPDGWWWRDEADVRSDIVAVDIGNKVVDIKASVEYGSSTESTESDETE